jgi:hypothetical protein
MASVTNDALSISSAPAAPAATGAHAAGSSSEAAASRNMQPMEIEREQHERPYAKDLRFWSVILALCSMNLLSSLENTVIVTSLPTIAQKIDLGSNYVWVGNIFFLTW